MSPYYKAARLDGTSFHDPAFRWIPQTGPVEGRIVRHRLAKTQHVPDGSHAGRYLSVSVEPTDCTGMDWPCRLLVVEPVDGFPVVAPDPAGLPRKRAARAWRVVREVDATLALGPQGSEVAALIERALTLTAGEARGLSAAWDAARDAAMNAAMNAARGAAMNAAWYAARDAAMGLLVRDLISREHYDALTLIWRTTVGPIHPDDKEPDQ